MLTALHIQDYLLIDRLSLSLAPGMTALTGETGAGKSILLDALGLACGGRSSRGGVREGADQGVITVAFEPSGDHRVWALLRENGLDTDDDQVILRRVQGQDGRGRGFVNDRPVSITMLRTIGDALMEIHGQHDGRGFLSAATHRELLDTYGQHAEPLARVREAWETWQAASAELEARKARRETALREADYLRHVVAELAELAPAVGEEERLAEERAGLIAAEKMLEDIAAARDGVDDDMLEERFSRAARALASAMQRLTQGTNEADPLVTIVGETAEKLDVAISAMMEARAGVVDLSDRVEPDPDALSDIEERLFAIRAAARKHGVAAANLPAFLEARQKDLALIEADEESLSALEKEAQTARRRYFDLAQGLSANRQALAAILDKAVMAELGPLKLGAARFETRIESDESRAGPSGVDAVEFMVQTNPGSPMGPLKTIASGGELSRFVLAMKAALAAQESRTVIIFDEVDAGVGGAVADAVGERLARLAERAQVLVVTHSPQVAARASGHWRVSKDQQADETLTRVEVLGDEERAEEIARMLSGASVTDAAREAARTLLAGSKTGAKADKNKGEKTRAPAKRTAPKSSPTKPATPKRKSAKRRKAG